MTTPTAPQGELLPDEIWADGDRRWYRPSVGKPWAAIGVKYIRADLAQPVKDKKSISDKLVTVLKRWDDEEEYVHKTLAEELIKALIEVGVIRVKE